MYDFSQFFFRRIAHQLIIFCAPEVLLEYESFANEQKCTIDCIHFLYELFANDSFCECWHFVPEYWIVRERNRRIEPYQWFRSRTMRYSETSIQNAKNEFIVDSWKINFLNFKSPSENVKSFANEINAYGSMIHRDFFWFDRSRKFLWTLRIHLKVLNRSRMI